MKVAINRCYGGFSISTEAQDLLKLTTSYPDNEDFGIVSDNWNAYRTNKRLIEVIETLGEKANGDNAELKVIEIPDDVNWTIDEYDGIEHIAEVHRTWG